MKCYLFYDWANRPAIIVFEHDCWKAMKIAQQRMGWQYDFTPLFRQITVVDEKAIVLDVINRQQHVGS